MLKKWHQTISYCNVIYNINKYLLQSILCLLSKYTWLFSKYHVLKVDSHENYIWSIKHNDVG